MLGPKGRSMNAVVGNIAPREGNNSDGAEMPEIAGSMSAALGQMTAVPNKHYFDGTIPYIANH